MALGLINKSYLRIEQILPARSPQKVPSAIETDVDMPGRFFITERSDEYS